MEREHKSWRQVARHIDIWVFGLLALHFAMIGSVVLFTGWWQL